MNKKIVAALTTLALVFPATAGAENFGRLFPELPPLNSQTNQQLADLAQTQLDPNADAQNNCDDTTIASGCLFSGFTYFGQFIDHDVTLDRVPQPFAPIDPATIPNNRDPSLDLDSVYGGG